MSTVTHTQMPKPEDLYPLTKLPQLSRRTIKYIPPKEVLIKPPTDVVKASYDAAYVLTGMKKPP